MLSQGTEVCLGVLLLAAVMASAAPTQDVATTTEKPAGWITGWRNFVAQVKQSSWELIHSLSETPRPDWSHHLDEDPEFVKAHPKEAAAIRQKYHPSTLKWMDDIDTTTEQEDTTVQDTASTNQEGNAADQEASTTAQEPDMTGQDAATPLADTTSTNEMATLAEEATKPIDQLEDGTQNVNGTKEDVKDQYNAPKGGDEALDRETDQAAQEEPEAHEEGTPNHETPNEQYEDVPEKKLESPEELKKKYKEYHKEGRRKHKGIPSNP